MEYAGKLADGIHVRHADRRTYKACSVHARHAYKAHTHLVESAREILLELFLGLFLLILVLVLVLVNARVVQVDIAQRDRCVRVHVILLQDFLQLALRGLEILPLDMQLRQRRVRIRKVRRHRQRLRDDRLVRADVEVGLQREKFVRHGGGASPGPGRERG